MSYTQLIKQSAFRPIYSPRTSYSRYFDEIDVLTTHLAINIDKFMLGFFKQQFEACNNCMNRLQFIMAGKKHLGAWQKNIADRDNKIIKCLNNLFSEIDQKKQNKITWNEFNSLLIEKVLNLKSLRNQMQQANVTLRPLPHPSKITKFLSPVQKLVYIKEINKIAYFCQQSNVIEFISVDDSSHQNKSLNLSNQQLIVETTISRRKKQGGKENFTKQVAVSSFKNTYLDMIYINDAKYKMLLTSSTDKVVRGWDMSSSTLSLAKQPQNEDEKMVHQFPVEIHTMTWDSVNQVLYCSGKQPPKIYEWLVKTDSQTQLWDKQGHKKMISCMIMMPKLQFLASGGYDGKLVLWDTIAQQKKFVYEQHTRSIVDMTFHEGLILLFTCAFDHAVCVWNPYIPSLIHKIPTNTNIIQLDIIPQTNSLLMLDANGLGKIRQINKFTLISQFTIQRQDEAHKIQATTMVATDDPVKYFFGGQYISSFEFLKMDQAIDQEFSPFCLKCLHSKFKLLTPYKNSIFIWDLLTGKLHNNLKLQAESEISAYDICQDLKIAVIGDLQGELFLRKADCGLPIKKLHQFKTAVTLVLICNGDIWCDKVIFAVSQQGEIIVFGKQGNSDFALMRNFSIKKLGINSSVSSIFYLQKRNLLVLATLTGQIVFVDVDKSKNVSSVSTGLGEIHHLEINENIPVLIGFNRRGAIFSIYLPPHIKKFKMAGMLQCTSSHKMTSAALGANEKCFIGYENGDIQYYKINQQILIKQPSEQQENQIKFIWKINISDTIKDFLYLEKQNVLFVATVDKGILLVSCSNGTIIGKLKKTTKSDQAYPLFLLDEEKHKLLNLENKQYLDLKTSENKIKEELLKNHNPFYYLQRAKTSQNLFQLKSNKNWLFNPQLNIIVNNNIQEIIKVKQQLSKFEKIPKRKKNVGSIDLIKAIELQKRWEKLKQQQEEGKSNLTGTNMGMVKSGQIVRADSFHTLNKYKSNKIERSKDQSSSLIKLGYALQKIDSTDPKALKFIQFGQKGKSFHSKNPVKLPKLI